MSLIDLLISIVIFSYLLKISICNYDKQLYVASFDKDGRCFGLLLVLNCATIFICLAFSHFFNQPTLVRTATRLISVSRTCPTPKSAWRSRSPQSCVMSAAIMYVPWFELID